MSSKIAIIVPYYNAEATLSQLFQALAAQTWRDFVVLMIDDGSTDNGRSLVQAQAQGDPRFVALTGKHQGPGAARNVGLEAAAKLGVEYLTFVDADDLPMPEMLSTAMAKMEETGADIVHYQWSTEPNGPAHKDSFNPAPIYVWNKLYRTRSVGDIRFVAAKFGEDLAFFLETEAKQPRRARISKPLYVHLKNANSLWENRTPEDVAASVKTVVGHLLPRFASPDIPKALLKDWYCCELPGLLKMWKKGLRKVLREKRAAAIDEYLEFVSGISFPGCVALGFRLRQALFVAKIKMKRFGEMVSKNRLMHRLAKNRDYECRHLKRLPKDRKIRVYFHVTDVSKWKCQSLYDALERNDRFEPVIFVDLSKPELDQTIDVRGTVYEERIRWFASHGLRVQDGYDIPTGKTIDIPPADPCFVFYQQPWGIRSGCDPVSTSRFAITCYIPYSVPNYSDTGMECETEFHHSLDFIIVLNKAMAKAYSKTLENVPHVCDFVPLGHPMLDAFVQNGNDEKKNERVVIYAPHWTFSAPGLATVLHIGTFDWNGLAILDYAKHNPMIKWVFKPHPLLKQTLVSSGYMTSEEVDAYYEAWGKVGIVCLDADYPLLFRNSYAMVTDCGSFLSEYAVTEHPIIHLISAGNKLKPMTFLAALYSTYYRVHNVNELKDTLDMVVANGEDPRAGERLRELSALGTRGAKSADVVLQWLLTFTK